MKRKAKKKPPFPVVADKWKTVHECKKCRQSKKTNHLYAQFWGMQTYRITCEVCGWSTTTRSNALDHSLGINQDE